MHSQFRKSIYVHVPLDSLDYSIDCWGALRFANARLNLKY